MKVPQFSPWINTQELKEIAKSIKDNWITEGPKANLFSKKLLKLIGTRYGVFAPNGTLALYLGLKALDIGPGDEVIVPDFTFLASATSVEMTGATPIFIGVNRKNFQIDLTNADKIITKKTRAIMPVHIFGTIANMKLVKIFAIKHHLLIIEDAAQAIGVHRNGKHAGTFGNIGCFSFFADKTITTAEGGFITTNNKKLYQKLLYLRNQGRINRGSFIHPQIGYNFRITDIQAAMGLAQLRKLKQIIKRKKRILSLYQQQLKNVPNLTFFQPDKGAEWIPFRVAILHNNAHQLMEFLKEKSIEPRTFFYPLHKQPCFTYLKKSRPSFHKYQDKTFPNSVFAYQHGICLPTFPTLTKKQITYVCKTIKDFQNES